ncbi:MAG: hypothetical protein WBC71_14635 [Salaquimonas sp.]
MNQFERLLRSAIVTVDVSSQSARLKVYEAAVNALSGLPEENLDIYRQQLSDAITKIEAEYADSRVFNTAQSLDSQVEPQIAPVAEAPPVTTLDDTVSSTESDFRQSKAKSAGFKRVFWIVALLAIGLIVASLIYSFSGTFSSVEDVVASSEEPQNTQNVTEVQKPIQPVRQVGTSENDLDTMLNASLPQDIDELAGSATGTQAGLESFGEFVSNDKFILSDNATIYGTELFAVETSGTYLMRLEFEIVEEKSEWPVVNAGVATFDINQQLQTDKPGTHRYFVNSGPLLDSTIVRNGNTLSVFGLITGEGNESHETFRPGTKFVRPVVLYRLNEDTSVLALSKIELSRVD